ncbi:MAG: hypothetical protein EOP04_24150 [Proteobacteria bacterium]|nr:MAG: hypothetical protein EOP04_24150 [Pseudomonadota bacterium]
MPAKALMAILGVILFLDLQACRTLDGNSRLDTQRIRGGSVPEPLNCAAGAPHYLLLVESPNAFPGFTELRVPQFANPADIPGVTSPAANQTVRLDLCVQSKSVHLQKAVLFAAGELVVIDSGSNSKILGLNEAYFLKDYSALDIELSFHGLDSDRVLSSAMNMLVVRGHGMGAYFTVLKDVKSRYVLKAPQDLIRFGVFEDTYDGGASTDACAGAGGTRKKNILNVGTAILSLVSCHKAQERAPTLLKLSITDTALQLDSATRGKNIDIPEASFVCENLEKAGCQTLEIRLPHASYKLGIIEARDLVYTFHYEKSGKTESGTIKGQRDFFSP